MKKFSRIKKSSYSVFTIFVFLLIFSCFLGFTFYFINSVFNNKTNSEGQNTFIDNKIKHKQNIDSEKLAKDYADKLTLESSPKIAILIVGLGINNEVTNQAINKLPQSISLGFSSYLNNFDYLNNINRDIFMNIPMETYDYFFHDSGPYSLICNLGEKENSKRLDFILSKANLFKGVYTELYESFTDEIDDLNFLLKKVNPTNKLILYNDPKEVKPFMDLATKYKINDRILKANIIIGNSLSKNQLITKLEYLKEISSAKGYSVGIIKASSYNIDILNNWVKEVDKSLKFNIVNITTLVNKINK
ncbi:divergent polysaccharide deacetylase family protein [Rickettsiales endosymbiont of Trichoplax sp. H2]|uniref:divergent polysaccharide deacetylase family protein n=1 Tax=Rickettsiales endosymbiont of Trichoplax sp. H2 TaxID=2021221 RepID=UPI0012B38F13|nr:divergent polysaccharide deacetylase family protein [Rickettsiales endosymbiont of Trichoplax sp. H2]MSO13498.1 hypothetical protein [Rickettsiales endosymbiont of Trichoplax sp. H2]